MRLARSEHVQAGLRPRLFLNLGAALMGQGRREEAVRHFVTAVTLDPDNTMARGNLERALAESRDTP